MSEAPKWILDGKLPFIECRGHYVVRLAGPKSDEGQPLAVCFVTRFEDAVLIAAAPSLLKACQDALEAPSGRSVDWKAMDLAVESAVHKPELPAPDPVEHLKRILESPDAPTEHDQLTCDCWYCGAWRAVQKAEGKA